MRLSIITIKHKIINHLDDYFSYYGHPEKKYHIISWEEEMLIPRIIGKIDRFLHNTISVLKLLPQGGRYRGDVELL